MRSLIAAAAIIFTASLYSCKSSSGDAPKTFCDTACLKDSVKFTGDHALQPYVYIGAKNCLPDSVLYSYKGIGVRKASLPDLLGGPVNINKDVIRCFFRDTAVAYVMFNDCATGRGFQLRIPFNRKESVSLRSSGINSFDPKFSVAENLMVSTDRGNIFVEDMSTGKKAEMTFGEKLDIDYDNIHTHLDSVHITSDHIWTKVLVGKEWVVKEKKIELK